MSARVTIASYRVGDGGPGKPVAWCLPSQSTQFRWVSVMWMVGTSAEDHRNPKEVESNMSHPVLGEVLEEMGPAVTLRGQQGPETRGPGGEQAGPWRAEAGGWKGLRPRDRAELARRWWRAVEQVCALRGMHCEQVTL